MGWPKPWGKSWQILSQSNSTNSPQRLTASKEFIQYRDSEWDKSSYHNLKGMDSLLLEWFLIKYNKIIKPSSWQYDGIIGEIKVDFKEIKPEVVSFGIPSLSKLSQYRSSYRAHLLDAFVFYTTERSTDRKNEDRSQLKAGDIVKFNYMGLVSVPDLLNDSVASSYNGGYKYLNLRPIIQEANAI